ncbi:MULTISPECIES: XcbB/CpsF family capsular polysaccharide biosynthesis protein [Citrobacter]|uniref:XcbB/CpsF family capsular polysaccharide biosynthesis protein n=1 Tax=Citrobacter TaxID=544 RepID=UPI0008FD7BC8|nr:MULTISPECIES: XcbB/CpsF family capsular polysaccharide biosynthesis protein [Citrobacter]OIY14142.1 hypothetical protein BED45_24800 [Citrobacter freundii]QLW58614.1 XcbB/CpsF family capsular polysaccharide biosynthesis protein [Citrobacter sp. RHBSTW-00667]
MSSSVLHMDGSETLEEIYNILQGATYKYIHFNIIDKSDTDKNIIELSFDDNELKQKLIVLANYGFMVYVHRGSVSSLVHYSEIKNLWIPVKEGDYSINPDGVVYSFEKAQCSDDEKLLVVFSQMPLKPFSGSLYRYFAKNFATIGKYVGNNVSILRIADIGGITGAFYLDTNALPNNANNISGLLNGVIEENDISPNNVVLYGCSKGGTAAVYHGLTNNYKVVAVDPILDDGFYITKKNDLHLIDGIFPETKRDVFNRVISEYLTKGIDTDVNIIVSQNSEQYEYIMDIIKPISDYSTIANSTNDKIKSHPDVGPHSVHMIVTMINTSLSGIKLSKGMFNFI